MCAICWVCIMKTYIFHKPCIKPPCVYCKYIFLNIVILHIYLVIYLFIYADAGSSTNCFIRMILLYMSELCYQTAILMEISEFYLLHRNFCNGPAPFPFKIVAKPLSTPPRIIFIVAKSFVVWSKLIITNQIWTASSSVWQWLEAIHTHTRCNTFFSIHNWIEFNNISYREDRKEWKSKSTTRQRKQSRALERYRESFSNKSKIHKLT